MIETNIRIQPVTSRNIKDAFYLYKKHMKGPGNLDVFKKKYSLEKGIGVCSSIAYYEGKPAGLYGVYKYSFNYKGEIVYGAYVGDLIIIRELRGKGLYRMLFEHTCDLCKTEGYKFLYGLHSEVSYKAAYKLGWIESKNQLYRFVVPLKPGFAKNMILRMKNYFHLQKKPPEIFQSLIVSRIFQNVLNNQSFVSCIYDEIFLNYKTFAQNFILQQGNVKFWARFKTFLEIGAVEFYSGDDLQISFTEVFSIAEKSGFSELIIFAPANTVLFEALKTIYTPLLSWTLSFYPLDNAYSDANLFVTSCESDTF